MPDNAMERHARTLGLSLTAATDSKQLSQTFILPCVQSGSVCFWANTARNRDAVHELHTQFIRVRAPYSRKLPMRIAHPRLQGSKRQTLAILCFPPLLGCPLLELSAWSCSKCTPSPVRHLLQLELVWQILLFSTNKMSHD